jgi:hypothetical protein
MLPVRVPLVKGVFSAAESFERGPKPDARPEPSASPPLDRASACVGDLPRWSRTPSSEVRARSDAQMHPVASSRPSSQAPYRLIAVSSPSVATGSFATCDRRLRSNQTVQPNRPTKPSNQNHMIERSDHLTSWEVYQTTRISAVTCFDQGQSCASRSSSSGEQSGPRSGVSIGNCET